MTETKKFEHISFITFHKERNNISKEEKKSVKYCMLMLKIYLFFIIGSLFLMAFLQASFGLSEVEQGRQIACSNRWYKVDQVHWELSVNNGGSL